MVIPIDIDEILQRKLCCAARLFNRQVAIEKIHYWCTLFRSELEGRGAKVEFEWDEAKRQQVLRERGVDILNAALIFEGPVLTRIDDRADYGEIRQIALGIVDDECFVVVFTDRGTIRRLITAWKGGRSDRARYQESLAR